MKPKFSIGDVLVTSTGMGVVNTVVFRNKVKYDPTTGLNLPDGIGVFYSILGSNGHGYEYEQSTVIGKIKVEKV